MQWKILSKQSVYSGFLSIDEYELTHELYAGGQSLPVRRQLMERGHAVAVLLFDPRNDSLVLIEQFRIGAIHHGSPWLLELVAGMIEEGELEEEVVRRECLEEAGVNITKVEKLFTYYASPGGCSEEVTLYYAEVDSSDAGGIHGLDDENEDILVKVISYDDVIAALRAGQINSATPLIAIQWLQLNHQRLITAND